MHRQENFRANILNNAYYVSTIFPVINISFGSRGRWPHLSATSRKRISHEDLERKPTWTAQENVEI